MYQLRNIYLGEPLQYIFNHMKINIAQGNTIVNYLDYMPILKTGFTTYNVLENMIGNYVKLSNQSIEEIDLFNEAFGDMPAAYVMTNAGKITMETAVKSKLVPSYLSTFDLMNLYPDDNTELDYNFIYNNVVDQHIEHYHLKKNIKIEGQLEQILSLLINFYNLKNTVPLEDLVQNSNNVVLNVLLGDPRINMYVAIIVNDVSAVASLLSTFDVRKDNHEAYKLALKYKNNDIINMIKNDIVSKNLYENEIFDIGFSGYGTAKNDLQSYYRRYI